MGEAGGTSCRVAQTLHDIDATTWLFPGTELEQILKLTEEFLFAYLSILKSDNQALPVDHQADGHGPLVVCGLQV